MKAALILLLGVLAMGQAMAPAEAADALHVGVAAVYPPYSIPYAANELGFYKAAGLDVAVTLYRGSSPAQEAVASGLADVITVPPYGAALAISKGLKEKIIAFTGDLRPLGWYVMARKDTPIKTMADLQGKTIGVGATGSTTDLLALVALSQSHVTARRIPLGNQGVMPALKAHQIAAGIAWPLPSYEELLSGDFRPIFDFSKMKDTLVLNAWAASDAMIDHHPGVLRRWLDANEKTVHYMQDPKNKAWVIAFLKHYTGVDNDKIIGLAYQYSIMPLIADPAVKPAWLETSLKVAAHAGIPHLAGAGKGLYAASFVPSWSAPH